MNIIIKPKLVEDKFISKIINNQIEKNSFVRDIWEYLSDYFLYFIKIYYDFMLLFIFLITILFLLNKYNKKKKDKLNN